MAEDIVDEAAAVKSFGCRAAKTVGCTEECVSSLNDLLGEWGCGLSGVIRQYGNISKVVSVPTASNDHQKGEYDSYCR